jgi:multidrug efflux pump subunit AcrA (membrane-fusion protein)
MKKLIVAFIVVLLIGVVSYRACVNIRAKKEALSRKVPEKVVPVRVMQPRLREIFEKIRASGSLQARTEVLLVPKVSGKIIRNLVQMGSPVRKGDIVSIINRDEVGYEFKPYEIQSDGKGVVSRILLNPGASVNPATPIMAIVDIDTVKAVMAIDELKIRFVRVGLAVQLKMAAYPDDAFAAKVTAISPVANPQTRAIDIEITVPNPGYRLKPGMYAEMEMVQSRHNGLVLPIAAVVDRGGQKFVFRIAAERAIMVPVQTGAITGDEIEIVSGLQESETVVASGADRLENGDRLNVQAR